MILHGTLQRFPDAHALARAAADGFAERAAAAAREGRRFSAALTGGGSPVELYRLLASEPYASRIPWDAVHLFWGDERCVPPRHPRSNYGMAHHLLVSRVSIPEGNVHRIRGELPPRAAAERYREELRGFFGAEPRFDLVHLGLGGDGHVASLFPLQLPQLLERERWACTSVRLPEGEPRVTLTYPVINGAARVEVLLPSDDKARIARRAMRGPLDPLRVPAQGVRPRRGDLVWLATDPVARVVEQAPAAR